MVPENIDLDLMMKYGELKVASVNGETKLGVKYGDLNVDKLSKNSEIYLAYSDAHIDKLQNAKIEVKYSDL